MKRFIRVSASLLIVFVFSTCVNAGIVSLNCYNDGDGAITMNQSSWGIDDPADGWAYMDETLHWAPAHALVDVSADGDPTVRITKDVDNDTGSAWNGYVINVVKSGTFSITSATQPGDWGTPLITAPALQLSGIYAGDYLGTVSYPIGTGTPILDGGSGVFKLTTSFTGSTTLTLEQIPTWDGVAIPEPGTLTLLLAGGLCAVAIFKRRQQAV